VSDVSTTSRGPGAGRQRNEEFSTAFGLLLLIVVAFAVFYWAAAGFSSPYNLYALTRTAALNVLLGLAMMIVIVTGGLDLSVGAVGIASAMFAGYLMQDFHVQMVAAIIAALFVGGALGFCNGFVVIFARVHSFIVTLASMSIIFGAMIVLTGAESIRDLPPAFLALGRIRWFGHLSPMLAVSVGIGVLIAFILRWTDFGREVVASGANPRAATLSGVRVGSRIIAVHAIAGALAASAGIMLSIRNGAMVPSMAGNLGQEWLLPAFLAPVLGGTLLSGGRAWVLTTVLAALLVTELTSGMLLMSIGEFWVQFALGSVLLLAVLLEKARSSLTTTGAGG
jgi:ribose transport system permease protein